MRGCSTLKERLETILAFHDDIYKASASTITGNLLVIFHPEKLHEDIAALVHDILRNDPNVPALHHRGNGGRKTDGIDIKEPEKNLGISTAEDWPHLAEHEALFKLQVSADQGLNTSNAGQRLLIFGPNTLPLPKGRTRVRIFWEQFHALPLILLSVESALALVTGAAVEAAVVAGVVAVNILVGYWVDSRTQRTLIDANRKTMPAAEVIRDGRTIQVSGEALVPGDILVLNPGVYVGADSRIIAAVNLKIDESLLTGESIPVDKQSRALADRRQSLFERHNIAFMGTLVVGGHGLAVVFATGERAEYGYMQHLMIETLPPRTLMTDKLHDLSRQLLHVGAWICMAAFGLGWIRGLGMLPALRRAVAMTTAIIPAGLPSTATANLAMGIHRLAGQRVAVRKLYALETLGAVRIICFDKTGTITRGRISVLRLYAGSRQVKIRDRKFIADHKPINPLQDDALRQLVLVSVLCNESKIERKPDTHHRMMLKGSPTEKALLFMGFLAKADIFRIYRTHALKQVVHRDEIRRRMITVHLAEDGRQIVSVKGDPLEVLNMCGQQQGDAGVIPLSESDRAAIENENDDMAADGLRVLGLAYKIEHETVRLEPEADYIWIGLVGIAEPIRKGVEHLMTELHEAGIQTVMITGDQNLTATAVAGRIGLTGGRKMKTLDSSRFDSLDSRLLQALIQDVQVFSRVNPSQKLEIVRAYRKAGYTVAMTGDGINDGPALRAADIGIAMGISGTDVAREVADIILEDDDLSNLGRAVAAGRTAHYNLKKSIGYFLSSNFSETALALAAIAAGVSGQPVRLNILADILPGLALLADRPGTDALSTLPVDLRNPLFSGNEVRGICKASAVLAAGAMGAYVLGAIRHGNSARSVAMAMETLTAGKILHALNCRNNFSGVGDRKPSRRNRWMGMAIMSSFALQWGILLTPGLRRLTGEARLGPLDLAVVAATTGAGYLLNSWNPKLNRQGPDSNVL